MANIEVLSTRSGFNTAVRHVNRTLDIAKSASADNLGDIIYRLADEDMTSDKMGVLLRMLLVDKMGYKTASANLTETVEDVSKLAKEFEKWNGVDLVAAYHHPEMGLLVANPKIAEELEGFGGLRKRELLVIYAGLQGQPTTDACQAAALLALKVFEGAKVSSPMPAITKGKFVPKKVSKPKPAAEAKPAKAAKTTKAKSAAKPAAAKGKAAAPAPAAKAVGGPVKLTPRYAVVVQNELFHNGNVEAWKRIIASYKAKNPTLDVFVYYENERILDINSLFKWGKVKHGTAIEFAIAGNDIKDVAKLQRYLAQGASHMFEAFLRGPVNAVLNLF